MAFGMFGKAFSSIVSRVQPIAHQVGANPVLYPLSKAGEGLHAASERIRDAAGQLVKAALIQHRQAQRANTQPGNMLGHLVDYIRLLFGGVPHRQGAAPQQQTPAQELWARAQAHFPRIARIAPRSAIAMMHTVDFHNRRMQQQGGGGQGGGGGRGGGGGLVAGLGMAALMAPLVANPIGAFVTGFTTTIGIAGGALIGLAVAGRRLADVQIEGARELAKFNGQIATAFAFMEARDIQRKIVHGAATAESTASLIEAVDNLKDAWEPFAAIIDNTLNEIAEQFVMGLTVLVEGAKAFLEWVTDGKVTIWKPPPKAPLTLYAQQIVDLAQQARNWNQRRPRRPRP